MTATRELSKWNRDLAEAIGALGSERFFASLIAAIREQVRHAYPQVWLYHRDLPPQVLYHEIPAAAVASQIDLYLEGPYQEDPFYRASMNRPKSRIYRLARLAAGKLEQSSYYRDYYGDTGTVDEVVYLARLAEGSAINLSIMRLPEQGEFSDSEYERLYVLADPVSELMRSHTEYGNFATHHLIQPEIDYQIEQAFRTFGTSLLSPREKDVLNLMLRGYGTDISAAKLDIARETVRRHRKSIYRKLDVSSQTDLFSLFINCMSCMGEAHGADPLSVYMGLS